MMSKSRRRRQSRLPLIVTAAGLAALAALGAVIVAKINVDRTKLAVLELVALPDAGLSIEQQKNRIALVASSIGQEMSNSSVHIDAVQVTQRGVVQLRATAETEAAATSALEDLQTNLAAVEQVRRRDQACQALLLEAVVADCLAIDPSLDMLQPRFEILGPISVGDSDETNPIAVAAVAGLAVGGLTVAAWPILTGRSRE